MDTSDPRVRRMFAHGVAKQKAKREQLFRRLRIDHVTVETHRDYVRPIAELFRARQKRATGYR